jgi:hydrogenase maturation protease
MVEEKAGRTVILGVGNLLLSDEGVGVQVARRLEETALPAGVAAIDAGTLPIEALGSVENIEKLIIIDAVRAGGPPGAIYRLPVSAVAQTQAQVSLHELPLALALNYWTAAGLPEDRIVIIGVEPALLEWGTDLSPTVAGVIDKIIELVLTEVTSQGRKEHDSQQTQAD